jgi:hypothetical protein
LSVNRKYKDSVFTRLFSDKDNLLDCINRNILKRFLETNSSEVNNMLLTEWDWDAALRVRGEECRAEGKIEGKIEGKTEGMQQIFEYLTSGHSLEDAKKKFSFLQSVAERTVKPS